MTHCICLYSARMHALSGPSTADHYVVELLCRNAGASPKLQLPTDLEHELQLSVGTGILASLVPHPHAADPSVRRAVTLRRLLTHRSLT